MQSYLEKKHLYIFFTLFGRLVCCLLVSRWKQCRTKEFGVSCLLSLSLPGILPFFLPSSLLSFLLLLLYFHTFFLLPLLLLPTSSSKNSIIHHLPGSPLLLFIQLFLFFRYPLKVPTGSPSRGGDVTVYVFNINQQSLPTPFYSVLVSVSVLCPFSYMLFHKFSQQFFAFSLCSPNLIFALLVLSTIYLFLKVSLNE